jgi:NTP pyrophosphatase (non-canonical NTP hydrolase)
MSFNNISAVEHARNQQYVHRVNTEKGWFDKPVTFLDTMALLTTEIVEAADAYDDEGLLGGWQARSQLSSELADIYIRLIDDCSRFGIDLGLVTDVYQFSFEQRAGGTFDGTCMQLVRRVREVIEAYRKYGLDPISMMATSGEIHKRVAHLYLQFQATCDMLGVDLMKAFEAKMLVNETREHRHGNKFA